MPGRRSALVTVVAVLLAAPASSIAAPTPAAPPAREDRATHRSNRALTKVIIFGSIGAIVGALGTLRKRNGNDSIDRDDETSGR